MENSAGDLLNRLAERAMRTGKEFHLVFLGQPGLAVKCGAPTPEHRWCMSLYEGCTYTCFGKTAAESMQAALNSEPS